MGALEGFGQIRSTEIGPGLSASANDSMVRAVLGNALRVGVDIAAVGETCAQLGLDLDGALKRAGAARVDNPGQ